MPPKRRPRGGETAGGSGKLASRSGPRGRSPLAQAAAALRKFALSLPGAVEDFPWGERVAKVGGKVFVFLGTDPAGDSPLSLSVKLPESGEEALTLPFTKPTGYGLGKSGWVTATVPPGDQPPVDVLRSWIGESYRTVAPKRLQASEEPRARTRGRKKTAP